MLADSGLLAAMKPGATYIDVSTIDPTTARKLSNAANVRGIHFLACPLGKTPAHAEKAEEPIFAGGNKEIFEKNKPVLEIIGSPIYYLGKMENGGGDEAGGGGEPAAGIVRGRHPHCRTAVNGSPPLLILQIAQLARALAPRDGACEL